MLAGASPLVTGAADGQTFVVMDGAAQDGGDVTLYRLRAGPGGRTLRVDRLPAGTSGFQVDDVALSPDGSQLAIAEQCCLASSRRFDQLQVRSLATGATRTWRTRAHGAPYNLSWSAGGRQMGFLWVHSLRSLHGPPPRTEYRLLDIAGPGRDLLAGRTATRVRPDPTSDIPAAFVTADGRAFVTSSNRIVHGRDHRVTVISKIIRVSARTGQVQRVLHTESATGVPKVYGRTGPLDSQGCAVLDLDDTGQHPLVQCFVLGRYTFGMVGGGRITPLPGIPNIFCTRACTGPRWGYAAW